MVECSTVNNEECFASISSLPKDQNGPVFAEPWQAQAFAMAIKLSELGYFTWTEWTETMSGLLKAAADRGEPDDSTKYYEYWLTALESLATIKGLTDNDSLIQRKAAWIQAYEHTPHGKPVALLKEQSSNII